MFNFQQTTIKAVQDLLNGSTTTNTHLDSLVERVQALELSQSLAVYPSQNRPEGSNPDTQLSDSKSRPPSPSLSESDDKESSIAQPGNREDLAAVLEAAAEIPTLTKRHTASRFAIRTTTGL